MKLNRQKLHVWILVLITIVALPIWTQDQPKSLGTNERSLIFRIGQEDQSDREFQTSGWAGQKRYICHIGVDCRDDRFPAELLVPKSFYPDYGVERVTIYFDLKQASNTVLRLARGGDETTVVIIDRKKTFLVTGIMLGSSEGFRVGTYELVIGELKSGKHSIDFTVLEDGKGNGAYQWDSITLFANNE